MPVKEVAGNTTSITYSQVVDEGRAFHSSVFELLGEQGWPGLRSGLRCNALGLWQMERIYRCWKGATAEEEAWIAPLAASLQDGGADLSRRGALFFQGIGYQPVMLMLVGLQYRAQFHCARIELAGRGPCVIGSAGRREVARGWMRGAVAA